MTRHEGLANNKAASQQTSIGRKILNGILIGAGILLGAAVIAAAAYVYNNLNYYKPALRAVERAGFVEKQATLDDGTVLNYGEGPNNGPALLLIHGQSVTWEDYAVVLPELSKHYHIYAVDCHGHGESSHDPEKYSAQAMGADFVWFIENVIGEPVVISGHSSGGLLTAWLAANSPENVRGIVLEDPPFFTTETPRYEKTFAWVDSFEPIHRFLNQSEEDDYTLFYLQNNYWLKYFGDGKQPVLNYAASYREKHPGEKLVFFFLPPSLNRIFLFMESYDPRFGDTFYDASWNQNFDHAETLARIKTPSVLIHASWSYDEDGILLAAMDGNDAERVHSLIEGNVLVDIVSGHGVHNEKSEEFTQVMIDFLDKIE